MTQDSIDTLRADHLGCYGYERETTPNIDKFAENAILFENAYSQAPSTMPALRAIMTGRLISNKNKKEIISYYENSIFLAEILKKKGYNTAGFSDHKGLGKKNEKSGFNLYRGNLILRGFDSFQNFGKVRKDITSHILTENITIWLDQNHKNKFFLWVHYFDPHFNYNPLPEYESKFGFSKNNCGRIYNGIDIVEIRKIEKDLTKKEIECLISLHQAEIFYTDKYIGKIFDKIKELSLEKNTIIIIVADHGEEFRERTRIGHEFTVYNELIHVPLIIKIPGKKPARIKESVGTREIFNILSNLDSDKYLRFNKEVISRTNHYYKEGRTRPNDFTIISENYKYIYNPETKKEEFYNLQEDILEKNNLVRNSPYEDKKQELKEKLVSWINENRVNVQEASKEVLEADEETLEQLKSLGYVN